MRAARWPCSAGASSYRERSCSAHSLLNRAPQRPRRTPMSSSSFRCSRASEAGAAHARQTACISTSRPWESRSAFGAVSGRRARRAGDTHRHRGAGRRRIVSVAAAVEEQHAGGGNVPLPQRAVHQRVVRRHEVRGIGAASDQSRHHRGIAAAVELGDQRLFERHDAATARQQLRDAAGHAAGRSTAAACGGLRRRPLRRAASVDIQDELGRTAVERLKHQRARHLGERHGRRAVQRHARCRRERGKLAGAGVGNARRVRAQAAALAGRPRL